MKKTHEGLSYLEYWALVEISKKVVPNEKAIDSSYSTNCDISETETAKAVLRPKKEVRVALNSLKEKELIVVVDDYGEGRKKVIITKAGWEALQGTMSLKIDWDPEVHSQIMQFAKEKAITFDDAFSRLFRSGIMAEESRTALNGEDILIDHLLRSKDHSRRNTPT
jgi:DNA-binding PadR family transcriptional regulator